MQKIKSLIIIILIVNCSSIYCQDWIKDTCEIKGPVKNLIYTSKTYYSTTDYEWQELTYEYNEERYMVRHNRSSSVFGTNYNSYYRVFDKSGTKCLVDYYIQDGDTASWKKLTYKKGKIVKSVLYNWGKYWNTTIYTYNEQGLLSGHVCTTADGWVHPESYNYDANGKIIYHEDISSTVKVLKYWKYDDRGLLIEEKYLDSNWAPRTTHYMDNDGYIDSSITVNNGKSAYTEDSYIHKFSYNEKGQLIEKIETEVDGTIVSKLNFTYNQYGDLETQVFYSSKHDKTYNYTLEYEYDHYGNWTSKITKVDGNLDQEETQKITYY